jgi:hypothetical protein
MPSLDELLVFYPLAVSCLTKAFHGGRQREKKSLAFMYKIDDEWKTHFVGITSVSFHCVTASRKVKFLRQIERNRWNWLRGRPPDLISLVVNS